VHIDRHDRASRYISVPSQSDCTKRYSVLSTTGDINMSQWSTVKLSVAWSKCACSISCLWSWEYRMKTNEKLPLINGNSLTQKQERRKDLTKTALMCFYSLIVFITVLLGIYLKTRFLQMRKKIKSEYQQNVCRIF